MATRTDTAAVTPMNTPMREVRVEVSSRPPKDAPAGAFRSVARDAAIAASDSVANKPRDRGANASRSTSRQPAAARMISGQIAASSSGPN
ncbi:MAG: hypothetical protein LC780_02345 [Acidobacteria bacterium]|nr:hypothetical protein [Acidobacteriota bacterium]